MTSFEAYLYIKRFFSLFKMFNLNLVGFLPKTFNRKFRNIITKITQNFIFRIINQW